MKNKDKLSKLQAIAKSVVKKETKRVNDAIKKGYKNESTKGRKIQEENKKDLIAKDNVAIIEAPTGTKDSPRQKKEKPVSRIKPLLRGKRFQAVFKEEDLDKIKETKIYLLQKGMTNVSSNGIVQAALRVLEHDLQLIDTYGKIIDEDNRRKTV